MTTKLRYTLIAVAIMLLPASIMASVPQEIDFAGLRVGGELEQRVSRNFLRLEQSKYQPANVFLTEKQSGGWPGDTEGRAILGLTLDAQTSHRAPVYLDSIIALVPSHLNSLGYMGPIYEDKINEQQLSGNGWMLRGLCEYYLWKHDERVLGIIKSIADNLFVKWKGTYSTYPIDASLRNTTAGAASGSIQQSTAKWMLSTDVGCVYIGMEGLVQAYGILKEPEIASVIEEMIERFLQQDLVGMKAQTHASLTACRGLIRYAELSGKTQYIDAARRCFDLYMSDGMTENFENYNWFDRFDTWTEPCAIVDTYMVAMQLWKHTGIAKYCDVAEEIYYNALGSTQRWNGGFGCDNCPGGASNTSCLKVSIDEAHWCCTMRGGEGLSRVAQYSYYTNADTAWITRFVTSAANLKVGKGELKLMQTTEYPFNNSVNLRVLGNSAGHVALRINIPEWLDSVKLTVNGKAEPCKIDDGYLTLKRNFEQGDDINLTFNMKSGTTPLINVRNAGKWHRKVFYGPLILGHLGTAEVNVNEGAKLRRTGPMEWQVEGTNVLLKPVYHLMDDKVTTASGYSIQILF
jgi:hypothetical protein